MTTAFATAVAALATAALLVGCQPPPKPVTPPPAPMPVPTATQVQSAQQQFAAIDPKARVGHVASVDAGAHIAAVAGIALADVKVGDIVSFTGPDHQAFANGTIVSFDTTSPAFPFAIVDYQKASSGGRDPSVSDLAITVPLGR